MDNFNQNNKDDSHLFGRIEKAFSKFNKTIKSKAYDMNEESPYYRTKHVLGSVNFSKEDIQTAIKSSDVAAMRAINDYYYGTNTSFRRIIDYFAFIYLYYYILDLKGIAQ